MFGRELRLGLLDAPLANGQMGHVLDFDDTHMGGVVLHTSSPVLAALFALTERAPVSGAQFMLAGAWLGGQRGVLLLQSSGVGNCINMLSLHHETRMPLLMVVTMRGEWGEFNPWQVAMGKSTLEVLEASGVYVYRADTAEEVVPTVGAGARFAFQSCRSVAVLIGQRVIGTKSFNK